LYRGGAYIWTTGFWGSCRPAMFNFGVVKFGTKNMQNLPQKPIFIQDYPEIMPLGGRQESGLETLGKKPCKFSNHFPCTTISLYLCTCCAYSISLSSSSDLFPAETVVFDLFLLNGRNPIFSVSSVPRSVFKIRPFSLSHSARRVSQ